MRRSLHRGMRLVVASHNPGKVSEIRDLVAPYGLSVVAAAELGLPFLGEIPIEADIRVKGDAGRMADLFAEGSPSRGALLHMCERTAMEIAKSVMQGGGLPTLEIL